MGRRELLQLGLSAGTLLAAVNLVLPEAAWARGKAGMIVQVNAAIDKENRAVWAYTAANATGKFSDSVAKVAATFKKHHQEHADALSAVVKKMRGKPAGKKRTYDLAAMNPDLASEMGLVTLAMKLEADMVKTYFGHIGLMQDKTMRGVAAGFFADEAMHLAVFRGVLGLEPVPTSSVTDPTKWSMV